MGNGLHLALVQVEGGLQQRLAIAGGAGAGDAGRGRQQAGKLGYGVHGGPDGAAAVVGVVGPQKLPLRAGQGQLGGGGACVDAQEAVTLVCIQIGLGHHRVGVAGTEGVVFRLVRKQRRQALDLEGHGDALGQTVDQLPDGPCRRASLRLQRRAHGGEQVGVVRIHDVFRRQLQRADKGLFQLRQEVQRPAQKGHAAPDGFTAGKAGDGLVHHRLKDRGGQIGTGSALVDERLDVGLGEHAAPGGDGVQLLIVRRRVVKALGVGLQQGGHLVDEGAGAAGAHAVHPLLQATGEIDDLGVLAAQLDGHIRLGIALLQRRGHRHHLLHKGDVQRTAQVDGAGAGDGGPQGAVAQGLPRFPQQVGQRLLGVGLMAAVIAVDDVVVVVQYHQLHGGGANVDTSAIGIHRYDIPPFRCCYWYIPYHIFCHSCIKILLKIVQSAGCDGSLKENWHLPMRRKEPLGPAHTQAPGAETPLKFAARYQYMPPMSPMPGAAAGAGGSGLSATRDSVVSTMPDTLAAFSRALRVTLAGSTMPLAIMSQYTSL